MENLHNRVLIVEIPSSLARPFFVDYGFIWDLPVPKDINQGMDGKWFGAVHTGAIRAVVGMAAFAEGMYIIGLTSDYTAAGKEALFVLGDLIHSLPCTLYGHTFKYNKQMLKWLMRHGWSTGPEEKQHYLMTRTYKIQAVC